MHKYSGEEYALRWERVPRCFGRRFRAASGEGSALSSEKKAAKKHVADAGWRHFQANSRCNFDGVGKCFWASLKHADCFRLRGQERSCATRLYIRCCASGATRPGAAGTSPLFSSVPHALRSEAALAAQLGFLNQGLERTTKALSLRRGWLSEAKSDVV